MVGDAALSRGTWFTDCPSTWFTTFIQKFVPRFGA